MAKKNPWYPMYASDWNNDTAEWPLEADGALIRLLNHQSINGSLPSDMPSLARICRVHTKVIARLYRVYLRYKFDSNGVRIVNKRLSSVLKDQADKQLSLSERGKRGSDKRWPSHLRKDSILESESDTEIKKEKRERARVPETESEIMKRIEDKIDPMEKEAIAVCDDIEAYLKSVNVVLVNPFHSTSPIRQCLESGITKKQIGAVYRMIFEDPAPSKDTSYHKGKLGSAKFGYHLKDKWGELYAKVESAVGDNQSAMLKARYPE